MNKTNNMCPSIEEYLTSYWIKSTTETDYPSLGEDVKVDVAIIGGGIVGITAGFLLKKQGTKVLYYCYKYK